MTRKRCPISFEWSKPEQSDMERVRLAVVGAGGQCTKSLIQAIPFIEEIELIAICGLKRELAERKRGAGISYSAYDGELYYTFGKDRSRAFALDRY